MYIATTEQLNDLVGKLQSATVIGIDTEFLRDKTFYPKLCLIQLCYDDVCTLVDPLAIADLTPLRSVLTDPRITKVFHAGDQDIAILFNTFNAMPVNVFDTQRAAQLLGYPFQVGLAALIKRLYGVGLDKGDTLTDWSARPLSDRQVDYALNDVRYLPRMYEDILQKLVNLGRERWVDDEIRELLNPEKYEPLVTEAYLRVKHAAQLDRRQLAIVRELATWREQMARKKDIPRKWIFSDEAIIAVARRNPKTIDELLAIHSVAGNLKRYARDVVGLIRRANALKESELPPPVRNEAHEGDLGAPIDLMTAYTHHKARESRIASQLLCSRSELSLLAQGKRDGLRILEGWRYDLLGNGLLELLDGKLCLSLRHENLQVTKSPQ